MKKSRTLFLTQFAILLAIEAIFCFTPLGSIPIGPIVATLGMIPVIITALTMGVKAGALMGFFAGLFSCIVWTFMPPSPITAFVFTPFYRLGEFQGNIGSLLICFVPRILVGVVSGGAFSAMNRKKTDKASSYAISGALGSLVNTILVMGGIWLFFGQTYSDIVGEAILVIIGTTVLTNGIPEAVVSAIAAPAICRPLNRIQKNYR